MEDQEAKAEVAVRETAPAAKIPEGGGALFDPASANHLYRVAGTFSKSALVPKHFQGRADDCFVALQLAARLGVDPWALMQNTYIVHGRPGFEAKFAIGLINKSGLILGRMKYRTRGTDPEDQGFACQAYATDAETGEEVSGEWITWKLVNAEGWASKDGSKWKTMPGQMFHYRAAMFFIRRYYPEALLGMQTTEELRDIGPAEVVSVQDRAAALKDRLNGNAPPEDDPSDGNRERSIIPPATEGTTDEAAQMRPEPSPEDNAAEDARLEALAMLHEVMTAKGVNRRDETAFLHLMAKANSLKSLTKEQAEACIVKLEDFPTARKLGAWIKQETARRKNGPPPGTLFKE